MTWDTVAQALVLAVGAGAVSRWLAWEPRPRPVPSPVVAYSGRYLGSAESYCGRGICGLGEGHGGRCDF